MASLRKVALVILVAGFLLSASSCASSKSSPGHRNDIAQSYNQTIKSGQGGSGQPDRTSQNRAQKSESMKGPYKPQQDNYQQNSGSQGGYNLDNGLGNAIGGVIIWFLNGLFGSRWFIHLKLLSHEKQLSDLHSLLAALLLPLLKKSDGMISPYMYLLIIRHVNNKEIIQI